MRSIKPDNRLGVTLEGPIADMPAFRKVRVSNKEADFVDISFRRTIRMSDHIGVQYSVPPDCGPFPIFSVKRYKNNLPQFMAARGGVFIPIYQREAMWISFESTRPFAVKVSVDGTNAVTGEKDPESIAADLRRMALLYEGKSIQDYIVTGSGPPGSGQQGQQWLDGVAKTDGSGITQLVAMEDGSGYSVEKQISGEDEVRGIQIEIMPMKLNRLKRMAIVVRIFGGEKIYLNVSVDCTGGTLKEMIQRLTGILLREQCVMVGTECISDSGKLSSHGVQSGDHVRILYPEQCGPHSNAAREYMDQVPGEGRRLMEVAATEDTCRRAEKSFLGVKLIEQIIVQDFVPHEEWDAENGAVFNLQMLHAAIFEAMLGMRPPRTTVSEATYEEYRCQFWNEYTNESMLTDEEQDEDDHDIREVTLDKSGTKRTLIPVAQRAGKLRSSIVVSNGSN